MENNCSNHKKDIAGITDMKVLGEMIGDLHYESLADLLNYLHLKLEQDAKNDSASGRIILGNLLFDAALNIKDAHQSISRAWGRSKPFMTPNKL